MDLTKNQKINYFVVNIQVWFVIYMYSCIYVV